MILLCNEDFECNFDEISTKYQLISENMLDEYDIGKTLFTTTKEVKTGIDKTNSLNDETGQPLENTGELEKEMEFEQHVLIPEIILKNKISTLDVENIQSIK